MARRRCQITWRLSGQIGGFGMVLYRELWNCGLDFLKVEVSLPTIFVRNFVKLWSKTLIFNVVVQPRNIFAKQIKKI